ncbi:cation-translocating P-type ATPase [Roseivivax sp. CAU 1761]
MSGDDVLQAWSSGRAGLSADEVQRRRKQFGFNALPVLKPPGFLERLRRQLSNHLIQVLLLATAVTLLLGHLLDALVIFAVVSINALVGLVQEGRAANALAAVRNLLQTHASVRRGGQSLRVETRELVPGDVVLLEPGDAVPADMRLIEAEGLSVQEAALTGESVAVTKSVKPVAAEAMLGDREGMAYTGTQVSSGRGLGVVVATGVATELGKIGRSLTSFEDVQTPLLHQIEQFSRVLSTTIIAACGVLFVAALVMSQMPVDYAFLAMISLAVSAVPEGLPAVITIALSIGVQRMSMRGAIVRQLPAVETLGAVSVICTDKTGTLTINEMVARYVVLDAASPAVALPDAQEQEHSENYPPGLADLCATGALANDARVQGDGASSTFHGDPIDVALLSLARSIELDVDQLSQRSPRLGEIPFDTDARFMAVLVKEGDGRTIHVKGAPEAVFARCSKMLEEAGAATFSPADWKLRIDELAAKGLRLLAFARKDANSVEQLEKEDVRELTLLGVVAFFDPPSKESKSAVAACQEAGVRVKMITGDYAATAKAIAEMVGIRPVAEVLTGADIDHLEDEELQDRVGSVDVFARATPEHKLRLVEALQATGKIVAMTGDGVNDAPALKRAEIGVAMGRRGTDVAKAASDIVLTDDNFSTIVAAIREGRVAYDNIRKVIAWTLPTNGAEALIVIIAILLGVTMPISPTQILWINMVTSTALGLSLAFDPPQSDVLSRPPRHPAASLVDREMVWRTVLVSGYSAVAVFWAVAWSDAKGYEIGRTQALAVNIIVLIEAAYLLFIRRVSGRGLQILPFTRAVAIGLVTATIAQVLLTYSSPLQLVFGTIGLAPKEWLVAGGLAGTLYAILEFDRIARSWIRMQPKSR